MTFFFLWRWLNFAEFASVHKFSCASYHGDARAMECEKFLASIWNLIQSFFTVENFFCCNKQKSWVQIDLCFFWHFLRFSSNNSNIFHLRVPVLQQKLQDLPNKRQTDCNRSPETLTGVFWNKFLAEYCFLEFSDVVNRLNVSWPLQKNVYKEISRPDANNRLCSCLCRLYSGFVKTVRSCTL